MTLDRRQFLGGAVGVTAFGAVSAAPSLSSGMLDRICPFSLKEQFWPSVRIYDKQQEIVRSCDQNDETYVLSANMMGKDFIAAYIALTTFLRCIKLGLTCKIVTTSVKDDHLDILWGEIHNFVNTSAHPLRMEKGGPLVVLRKEIRHALERDAEEPRSYVKAQVSETGEGMSGHHAQYTMLIGDEASAIDDRVHQGAQGWAKRMLFITNANPCENFVRRACDGGDLSRSSGVGFVRKVIHLPAECSPNVRWALWQQSRGIEPTNEVIIPGVIRWDNGMLGYLERRKHWDAQRQCVGLDARFYEGPEQKLFPPEWLALSVRKAEALRGKLRRAKGGGNDPAEGGDKTSQTACDELGIIEQFNRPTPDTDVIPREAMAFMRKHDIKPERYCFDRGGGGKQAADRLRATGFNVRTIAFGESPTLDPVRRKRQLEEKLENREDRYTYTNRRVQMYWEFSDACDPANGGYAIPAECKELLFQLSKMPRLYDEEGRAWLPPKRNKDPNNKKPDLVKIIGHSPDEADSAVLAYHAMMHEARLAQAGVIQ